MRTDEQRRKVIEYLDTHPEQREKMRERARKAQAAKRAVDPGYQHRIGIYNALVTLQGGEFCLICGAGPGAKRLNIDHDHATDEIRGLLCDKCNRLLGAANDRVEVLEAVINYLGRTFTGRFYAELRAVPSRLRYTKKDVA